MRYQFANRLILISLLLISSLISHGQCAYDFEGSFGGRYCSQADTTTSYFAVAINALDSNSILVSNFHDIPNSVICNVEDTIVIHLDCNSMTADCEFVSYDLCSAGGGLSYFGDGTLYEDSIMIPYTQWNPNGSQEICIVYKRDAYVGLYEIDDFKSSNFYPNPTENKARLNDFQITDGSVAQIFDIHGQLAKTIRVNENTIDLIGLTEGLYLVEVEDYRGRKLIGRIIKQ